MDKAEREERESKHGQADESFYFVGEYLALVLNDVLQMGYHWLEYTQDGSIQDVYRTRGNKTRKPFLLLRVKNSQPARLCCKKSRRKVRGVKPHLLLTRGVTV
jgi:hypothetical protein